jgi:hypothetical protein
MEEEQTTASWQKRVEETKGCSDWSPSGANKGGHFMGKAFVGLPEQ